MRDRQSVIGFTEAELGLILMMIALALWVIAVRQVEASPDTVNVPRAELDALRDSARRARVARAVQDSLRHVIVDMKKRSRQTPTCSEMGYRDPYIASIIVHGPNSFEVEGERMDIGGVDAALATPLSFSKEKGCRHGVRVSGVPGLTVEAFTPGLRAIRRRFNTDIR